MLGTMAILYFIAGVVKHFCEGPHSKQFGFSGHIVSVATTQLCYYSTKAATNNI